MLLFFGLKEPNDPNQALLFAQRITNPPLPVSKPGAEGRGASVPKQKALEGSTGQKRHPHDQSLAKEGLCPSPPSWRGRGIPSC